MSSFDAPNNDTFSNLKPHDGPTCRIGHVRSDDMIKASIAGGAAGLAIVAVILIIKGMRWYHRHYALRFSCRIERRMP
jgi:hypothetical protein